jgi:hypothetical protein
MKLDDFEKLRVKLEVFKLEKNFFALNKVLYYFSFLGNIFLVYFGYFFIKSTVDGLPSLFPYQNEFLAIFIALFLVGYELTKRFVIEQTIVSAIQVKRFTMGLFSAAVVSLILIAGSFYLSLNGAHRLIDTTETVQSAIQDKTNVQIVELEKKHADRIALFNRDIDNYQSRINKVIETADGRSLYKSERATIKDWENQIAKLREEIKTEDKALEEKTSKVETKNLSSSESKLDKVQENDQAFVFMTFFLEFIIILGVGFNAYYLLGSYDETKKLLDTPKYRQMNTNLKLLKLYYQNGKKQSGDMAISANKFYNLVKSEKIQSNQLEVKNFVVLAAELEITKEAENKRKRFAVNYEEAKKMMMKEIEL